MTGTTYSTVDISYLYMLLDIPHFYYTNSIGLLFTFGYCNCDGLNKVN